MFEKKTAKKTDDGPAAREREASADAKGRATPSRKEAEAARRAQMKQQKTRRQSSAETKAMRNEYRLKSRAAMQAGVDSKYLPARDQGPVRQFVRDFIDRRRNIAEYLLPIVVVLFVLSMVRTSWAVQVEVVASTILVVSVVIDEVLLSRRLGKELKTRFSDADTNGARVYGILRSTQFRRWRMPKPVLNVGDPLKPRY